MEANSSSGAYGVVELPAKALTIQGGSHTLTASDTRTRNYIYTADDLTLDTVIPGRTKWTPWRRPFWMPSPV